ncbi:MAG: cache domain-containing protein [Anaerolineales bacterium]
MKSIPPRISKTASSISLRTRLVLGHMIVTFIAVAGLGYYVYYRAQQQNAYLTNQLDNSVRQQAEIQLVATSTEQAATINDFFATISKNVESVGTTADILLSNEALFNQMGYWDANKSLSRLPNGSWDNPNTEPSSVFLPAKVSLTFPLVAKLTALKQLDFLAPSILKSNPDIIAIYFAGTSGEVLYYPNIDLASQVAPDFDVTQLLWFFNSEPTQDPKRQVVWSAPYLDPTRNGLIVTDSIPVYDTAGDFLGSIAMDVQLNRITKIVSNIHVADTGYAFLIDQNYKLIGMPSSGYKELGISPEVTPLGQVLSPTKTSAQIPAGFWKALNNMRLGQNGIQTIQINGVEHFIAYSPLPSVGYNLAIIVPSQELLTSVAATQEQITQSARNTLIFSALLVLAILIIALLASYAISSALMLPLGTLTKTAQEITAGNLAATAEVKGRDEIGTLANTLNTMTSTLRENIQSLEKRVAERTSALEHASKNADQRAAQFEAIALVVKAVNSIHQMDALLPQITSVISERFSYYHVGIFLNNESDHTAELAASNSEGGKRMLMRGHRLKIGEQGIVGYVAATGVVRVARSVGEDAVYFNNPDLPETLSEMALPLRVGNQIVGVLDVQSKQTDAFSPEDIGVLSLLADEVSLAIDNTRLLESTRRSLSEAEALYRQYLRQAWSRLPREEHLVGYRYTISGSSPLESPVDLDAKANGGTNKQKETDSLVVPIKLRGELIGNIVIQNPQGKKWSKDQLDFVQAVADRVALSSENARLFDETSRRAERERMVTEITSKIRSTNSPEEMIHIALNELRSALGATQVQLITQTASASKDDNTAEISAVHPKVDLPHNGNGANQ